MNKNNNLNWLIVIVILLALSLWIDLSNSISLPNPFNGTTLFTRNVEMKLGLDLRGGLQALLEADLPDTATVSTNDLDTTRQILESRANGLGVSEVVMQTAGERRIVAEFPGVNNPEEVVASLQQTGLLEFVDTGDYQPVAGTILLTDYAGGTSTDVAATPAPDGTTPETTVYHTIMTGKELDTVGVTSTGVGGNYSIDFSLKSEGATIFGDHTKANVGKVLTITLDKKVISAPTINAVITDRGTITGQFTADEANAFAVQLRYGSLPVPVKVVESRTVGATLGEESIRKSLMAGYIGLTVVVLFMLLYYRLPGFVADLALITYTIFSLAIFKMIGVVLTLPGIAGFILSIGMAVDANILIFERLKEELRAGRNLRQAIDLGWTRAWPSIRDSNISTLITCGILYVFGSSFGASMVKGFSVTLALGVLVSLFTAIIVTRTYLHTLLDNIKLAERPHWFGL
ncbi:MAG: protein translocase subunit SecD [Anaerolineales bacterium]|nr:protein translocase subunit SecD [Anaerolineales bacterium]